MVDGKKCYIRADKLLPREDLVWSYDAKKLDLDEGATVRGQRHYAPQELKAIAIERQMREDDRAPPKRKKIRGRPGAITTTMISKDRSRLLSKPTRY